MVIKKLANNIKDVHVTKTVDGVKKKVSAEPVTVQKHEARKQRILEAIEARYPKIKFEWQLKCKHFMWVKNEFLKGYAESTKRDYIRTMRLMITALGKEHWLHILDIAKTESKGGRPSAFAVRKSKRMY
ncbi:hypothetical protein SAMN04487964_11477 [Marinobacterium sediminicola]|uniref:Integrase SAM-like N-terminal domain-containing protein n=2 Tax=Marinobacterium sediminicola TaxID=518898 RepID=A0ABY1S340_9GAMM|nr:hypothetical protein SAMN04487964_11477 [Marinobacterium sediminicola]